MYTKKNRYSNHRSQWIQFFQNNNKQINQNNKNIRSINDNINIQKCNPCLSCKTYYLLYKRKPTLN